METKSQIEVTDGFLGYVQGQQARSLHFGHNLGKWVIVVWFIVSILRINQGAFAVTPETPESPLEHGLRLLQEAENMDPEGYKIHGRKFDEVAIHMYDDLVKKKIAVPIKKTFAGDKIEHGYRIGNHLEVWLQKKAPGKPNSIDIIIWELKYNDRGKVVGARGNGADHHTIHPNSPKATKYNKNHWKSKKLTAQQWVNALRTKGFEIEELKMDPDNSFFWRESKYQEIDEFSFRRSKKAVKAMQNKIGSGVFTKTSVKAFGTTLSMLGTSYAAIQLLDALKKFYRSPILANVRAMQSEGRYEDARRYWKEKCMVERTSHPDSDALRIALANLSSLLSITTFTNYEDAMELLIGSLEKNARQKQKEKEKLGHKQKKLQPPPEKLNFDRLTDDSTILIHPDSPREGKLLVLRNWPLSVNVYTHFRGYMIPVFGARVQAGWEGRNLLSTTDAQGSVTFTIPPKARPGRRIIDLKIIERSESERLTIDYYDYEVLVKSDAASLNGKADGKDIVSVKLQLQKRLVNRDGSFRYSRPRNYKNDFNSLMILSREAKLIDMATHETSLPYLAKLRVRPPDSGTFTIGVASEWKGAQKVTIDLRGGMYRNIYTEVASFVVGFGQVQGRQSNRCIAPADADPSKVFCVVDKYVTHETGDGHPRLVWVFRNAEGNKPAKGVEVILLLRLDYTHSPPKDKPPIPPRATTLYGTIDHNGEVWYDLGVLGPPKVDRILKIVKFSDKNLIYIGDGDILIMEHR